MFFQNFKTFKKSAKIKTIEKQKNKLKEKHNIFKISEKEKNLKYIKMREMFSYSSNVQKLEI